MNSVSQIISEINQTINSLVWGPPMLILFIFVGIYFTVRTKFFQVFKIRIIFKKTIFTIFKKQKNSRDKHSISQFQALSTALAATIGTGSIVGVATAITIGGYGAIFWMWVSAFFGMMTAYAENVLGIYYRKRNSKNEWNGGPMQYIEYGLKSKWLAILFAVFCVAASFGIGNMAQSNSISDALKSTFSIPPVISGIVVAIVVGVVIIGGIKRLGSFCEKVIPIMAVFYILGAIIIIVINKEMLPAVFKEIMSKAFGPSAAAGGISGAMLKNAISMGVKRGVFSNEAGLGSSVMVHSAADVKEPVVQGMWGIFGVFIDTIVICSLTAFVILTSGAVDGIGKNGKALDGIELVIVAFKNGFGQYAGYFVSISILFFAFASIVGWSYFGEKAMEYLFGIKSVVFYKAFFIGIIIVGAIAKLELVWDISDTLNGLMAIPNLIGVFLLSETVIKITKNYLKRIKNKNSKEKPMLSAFEGDDLH